MNQLHIGSPDAARPGYFRQRPGRHAIENVAAEPKRMEIRRTKLRHIFLLIFVGGEDVVVAAFANHGGIVDRRQIAIQLHLLRYNGASPERQSQYRTAQIPEVHVAPLKETISG